MRHSLDTVEVINPTGEDFSFEYGKHPYKIKSGEKKTYNRFLADHLTKHLTDKMIVEANSKGKKVTYNDEDFRRECWNKIQIGTVSEFQPGGEVTLGEQVAKQQEKINEANARKMELLEAELNKIKAEKKSPKEKTNVKST